MSALSPPYTCVTLLVSIPQRIGISSTYTDIHQENPFVACLAAFYTFYIRGQKKQSRWALTWWREDHFSSCGSMGQWPLNPNLRHTGEALLKQQGCAAAQAAARRQCFLSPEANAVLACFFQGTCTYGDQCCYSHQLEQTKEEKMD